MESSPDFLPPLHPPGRSGTASAWSAFIALLLLILLGIFHPLVLRGSVRTLLWMARPFTGLTIQSKELRVALGEPLHWKNITITSGQFPHQSRLELQSFSLGLTSPWRMIFGDHALVDTLQASGGKGLIDLRSEEISLVPTFLKQPIQLFQTTLQEKFAAFSSSLTLHDFSLLIITENQRYNIDHFSCFFPYKAPGKFSYEAMLIELGTIKCHLAKSTCEASWDGKTIALKNLPLSEGVALRSFQLTPHADQIELGFVSTIFHGLLRADGCLKKNGLVPTLDGAILGQQLPMERLSRFLGLTEKISGNLREGRLIFRGSPLHLIDAEASLRILGDHFRWGKKEWASLSMAANLIGRKISVTDFQLKQHDNHVVIAGEMTLPEEWRKIAQAPFHCKLKATISDTSQLADLIGPPWNDITGNLFMEGEVQGAANRADGTLRIQGESMTLHTLPIDILQLALVFQGEQTNLAHFDLWSGSDHLQLSGIIANSWPHQYEGTGVITSNNFFEKLARLELPEMNTIQSIRDGSLLAHWNGHGSATNHEGSFDAAFNSVQYGLKNIMGHCSGTYTSEQIACPIFVFTEGTQSLSTTLTLSSKGIDLHNAKLLQDDRCALSGNILLPLDVTTLFHGGSFASALIATTPLDINITLRHFLLQDYSSFFYQSPWTGYLDGKIRASGLWSEPSLDLSLIGKNVNPLKITAQNASLALKAHADKGAGTLDLSIHDTAGKLIALKGSLPLGLTRKEESAPLKSQEKISLSPAQIPLHLVLSLSQISLDALASTILPPALQLTHTIASGELSVDGTTSQPQISGTLALQAEKLTLGDILSPLHALQAKLLFHKNKITLENGSALMGEGKINVSGVSDGPLWQEHHDYHFTGQHLLFYQSPQATFMGDATLSLQGTRDAGSLQGTVLLKDAHWMPCLTLTPFLIPPGMITPPSAPRLIPTVPSWTTDLAIQSEPPQEMSLKNSKTTSRSFEKIDMRLLGPLFSPAPEGSVTFTHLSLLFPQTSMQLIQGSMNFSTTQPWRPEFHLTASGILQGQKVSATLADTPEQRNIWLESQFPLDQETLALLLARPRSINSDPLLTEGWLSELPYWVRQQQLKYSPLSGITSSLSTPTTEKEPQNLGFTSSDVSYSFDLK